MNKKVQRIHFIGICGVAMSAVASALWEKGYKVSGSDAGFFPPVSTYLSKIGIPYYSGWHPEKMVSAEYGGTPDLVVVGNAASSQNPEFIYAKDKGIPFKSYPEAVGEYFIKPHSIVVAGTYGKTTSSALLSHTFRHAGLKPSFMFGGVTQDGEPSACIDTGDWSVVEGDEYSTAKWDKRAKFFHYKPTHLLLSAVKWDHADLYKTEKEYFAAFNELISQVPSNGKIVYCSDQAHIRPLLMDSKLSKESLISYGADEKSDYRYENVIQSPDGLRFDISYHGKKYNIESPLLGTYNAENITGCFAMAHAAGIAPGDISDGIKTFQGMKRRLEKRYSNKVTVIDDIAHSPEKAKSILNNLRGIYSGLVIAVYEPNIGNRTKQSEPSYKDAFKDADTVVIPRLSKLKVTDGSEKPWEGDELARVIGDSHKDAAYMEDDEKLVDFLVKGRNDGDVIAFLGSHGFRGMIEETIERLAGRN